MEEIKQLKWAQGSGGGGARGDFEFYKFPMLKLEYGSAANPIRTVVKLFSWPAEGGKICVNTRVHYGLGPNRKAWVLCPKGLDEAAPCPICEYVQAVLQNGSDVTRAAVSEIVWKERYWFLCANITELTATQMQKKFVYIWSAPPMSYHKIIGDMQQSWGDFTALTNGYLLEIASYKDGGSRGGKMNVSGMPQTFTVNLAEWQPLMPDYVRAITAPPPNVIEAMLYKSACAPVGVPRMYSTAAGPGQAATGVAAMAPPPLAPAPPFVMPGLSPAPAPAPFQAPAAPVATAPYVLPGMGAPSAPVIAPAPAAPAPVAPVAPVAPPPQQFVPPPVQPQQPTPPQPTAAPVKRTLADVLKKKTA